MFVLFVMLANVSKTPHYICDDDYWVGANGEAISGEAINLLKAQIVMLMV